MHSSETSKHLARAVLSYLERAAETPEDYDDHSNCSFQEVALVLEALIDNESKGIPTSAGFPEIRLIQELCTEDLRKKTWLGNCEKALGASQLNEEKKKELWLAITDCKDKPRGLFEDVNLNHAGFESAPDEKTHRMIDCLASLHFAAKAMNEEAAQEAAQSFAQTCISADNIGVVGLSTLLNTVDPKHFPAFDNKSRAILKALTEAGCFGNLAASRWGEKERYLENAALVVGFLEAYGISNTRVLYNARRDGRVKELQNNGAQTNAKLVEQLSSIVEKSANVILRGAPGTGKTYLAKQIAAFIVSDGQLYDPTKLSEGQCDRIEFVQFHPSYDYSDFVEGLRPVTNDNGTVGFELRDGIFKQFVDQARKNFEDSQKTSEELVSQDAAESIIKEFLGKVDFGAPNFSLKRKNTEFAITNADEKRLYISIPRNGVSNELTLSLDVLERMLKSTAEFNLAKDVTDFIGRKSNHWQEDSYYLALYRELKNLQENTPSTEVKVRQVSEKKHVFIIDEINRGEVSKILGELFFTIDPGYRGKAGEVSTQYSNLHDDPTEKFYIPENVYIIGTMNDIDRSVDTFDFAMRRRFRFKEVTAEDSQTMLDGPEGLGEKAEEAKHRMNALNEAIKGAEDLNENYQIGASYFLKLKELSFEELWTDYLYPLLQDYVRGAFDEEARLMEFKNAYDNALLDRRTDNDAIDS